MRITIIFLLFVANSYLYAQFSIGTLSQTYTDVSRSRDLPFELMYPASTSGNGVPCAEGLFPYVVIAHGFSMQATDYTYLAESLVSNGYMVLQLATETGFVPSHADYGLDILYLATHFREENITSGSLFEGHVMPKAGVIGHSMGGGSAWLAAAQANGNIDCVVGMAPAETNPSAIDVAPQVIMPAMILSGSSDAVTPPAQNHQPIYDGTYSSCKVFVNVISGSHCGFADNGTLCQIGELGFSGLAAATQQDIALDLVNAWMDQHLKDLPNAAVIIDGYDALQSNTQMENSCILSVIQTDTFSNLMLFPNPSDNKISISGISTMKQLTIFSGDGRHVAVDGHRKNLNTLELDISHLKPGVYIITDTNSGATTRFVVR